MSQLELAARIAPGARPEHEWLYLVNETYLGEQCILPLLGELLDAPVATPAFRRMIERQIGEERQHEALYRGLLGQAPQSGSGYDGEFSAFVRSLPSVTLRLFALQVLLEAIGVAAFEWRLATIDRSPSAAIDRRILGDEQRHTQFSYGFLRHLVALDGPLPDAAFHDVARRGNAIFARHFRGEVVARVLAEISGGGDLPVAAVIDASAGMRRFARRSAATIVAHKLDYLERYHAVCNPG